MKLQILKGSADVTLYVFVSDSASTTGAGKAGIAHNAAGLVASYVRPLGSRTAITLATQTVTGAHSDGGWVEVDATNMPGVYRLDLPDAVCASGVNSVVVFLHGASGMAPVALEIMLTAVNLQDAVRAGLTALPNAAADAAGGLPISDAGGLDLDALNTAAIRLTAARAQVLDDWINAGRLDLLLDAIKAVTDAIPNAGAMTSIATASAVATAQADLTTLVGRLTALRAGYLDNLSGGAVALASTLATVAGYIDTEVASILAAVDTEIAAIKAVTDLLPNAGALSDLATLAGRLTALRAGYLDNLSAGAVALEATLTAIKGGGWSTETLVALKAVVDAILVDTGTTLDGRIPSALSAGGYMKADVLAINAVTAAAARLALSAGQIIPGTVDSTAFAPTTTVFDCDDITTAAADHYIGRVVLFTSGTLVGQAATITDYALTAGRGRFTVDALTSAPADNVTFVII